MAASCLNAQQAQLSENLNPLQPLLGKWACEAALVDDLPGLGKKGEKMKFTLQYAVTRNGHAIAIHVPVEVKGQVIPWGDGIVAWDAAAKQFVRIDTFRNGGLNHFTLSVQGNVIESKFHGNEGDGVAASGSLTYTFQDQNTMLIRFGEGKKGSETKPPHGPYTCVRVP